MNACPLPQLKICGAASGQNTYHQVRRSFHAVTLKVWPVCFSANGGGGLSFTRRADPAASLQPRCGHIQVRPWSGEQRNPLYAGVSRCS